MPGGSPQGALLGVLLYLVYVSDIGMDTPVSSYDTVDLPSVPFPPPLAVTEKEARLKFVDDLSLAESIRLDTALEPSSDLNGPKTYHDRNGLFLPAHNSILQRRLNEITISAQTHDMKLNLSKTKIMPFNFTKKYDFLPTFTLDGTPLENVYETKLLGVTITSNCRWDSHTKSTVLKGNSRLWFLRRLKLLGASKNTLMDIYKLFCRSVLEYAAPVWAGALTNKNKQDLERVQRNALRIISDAPNTPYLEFLTECNEETLSDRRDQLSLAFAKKCLESEKFNTFFKKGMKTRSGFQYYKEIKTNKKRFSNSAIPYLIRLLNMNSKKNTQ